MEVNYTYKSDNKKNDHQFSIGWEVVNNNVN